MQIYFQLFVRQCPTNSFTFALQMGNTEKISFRIGKEDREKLKALAGIDQMKDSDYLRRLVRWAISKNKRFTK